jgi:predicted NAD/FAD-dependent oxidoreductase
MRVAVVGAGVAGLACARRLKAFGHAPLVFDKGKGPAGRMASRRLSTPVGEMAFDLGAQYFTVRSAEFADRVADWVARGVVAPWPEAGADAWTGVPTMSAPLKDLAEGLSIRWRSFVGGLSRGREGWSLHLETGEEGPFDVVVIALPVEQATPLLALNSALFPSRRALSASQPCWAAIYAFDAPLGAASDVIRRSGPIAFAARHGAKPGRTGAEG